MNHSILERLMDQVLCDLDEFIPKGCFVLEENLSVNGRELSWNEKWGMVAIGISTRLYYESKSRLIAVTPRQSIAIELLEHLGNLASCEATTNPQSERDKATDSILHTSLEKYLCYLPEHEAKPFVSLLKAGHQTQETTKGWEEKAKQIAAEIRKEKPSLTLDKLAEKTHTEMVGRSNKGELGMKGRGGKVPCGGTIKRQMSRSKWFNT